MLYLSITYIIKKITVASHYIFWCAWESTDKNLPKSQLDVEILIFDIIYSLQDLQQTFETFIQALCTVSKEETSALKF